MDAPMKQLAGMLDHSLLNPTFTHDGPGAGHPAGAGVQVASVCIMPYYLKRCAELLRGSGVKASRRSASPGGHATAIKLAEARQALDDGGEELDIVVNISKVLSGDWDYVAVRFAP